MTTYSHIAATFILLAVAPVCAADSPPATRPLGALLGESTLAFSGWPTPRGTDGPCGKAVGYWQVRQVLNDQARPEGSAWLLDFLRDRDAIDASGVRRLPAPSPC